QPSAQPSSSPSSQPTVQPSEQPSSQPSNQPTAQPTEQPSSSPSSQPTVQPSKQPSGQPSSQPTAQPTEQPSSSPSSQPTTQPSAQPLTQPSSQPSMQPSEQPSAWPSEQPNAQPSSSPTIRTEPPTKAPTISSGTLENNMSVSILGTTSSFKIVSNKFTLSNLLPLSDISINNANSATNYVLFGSATLKNIDVTGLIPSQGFSVSPAISYSSNSNSVSNIGDINQDGYDDLIIAPPSNDIIASVLFGTRDGFINMKEGFTIFGGNNNDGIPQSSVSSAGDFNNDGYPDIILGLPYEKYNGIAYVILGKKSGFTNIYLNKLDYTQGFSISASGARYFGSSVSSAGDVNGDGFDDLIISSSSSTNPDNYAHVVFGNKNIINLYLVGNLNINLGFRITIKEPYTIINGVSKIGDVNKDGYDDVLLSTAIFKGELIDVSYLIYGGRFLGGREIFVSSTGVAATQGIVIKGAGIVASYIGDINNDGYNDFMLGSGYSLSEPGYVVFTPDKFTVSPSTSPTIAPTLYHSPSPTIIPSLAPSLKPSMKPSPIPSTQPTSQPTSPTASPTIEPTNPTGEPTSQPSNPTHKPTSIPTAPTVAPTVILTPKPTIIPSAIPTCTPTISPSIEPTKSPSSIPTKAPTISPTIIPTELPSLALTTTHPSQDPTAEPSSSASVSMGIGTILGIAFGGITGVAAIIAGGYYCIKHYIFNNKIDPVNNINQAVNIDYKSQSDQVLSQLENGELKHQGSAKLSDLRPSSDTLADKKNSGSLDFMNYNNFGGLGGSLSSATFAPLNRGACLDTDSIQENTLLKPYIPIINNIIDDEDFSISSMSDLESIKEDSQSLEDNIKVSEIDEESTISGELSPDQYEI
ncbi:MAG: FG-GAP-like repeat-containing protein, partial [Rickettsiales bacterium]